MEEAFVRGWANLIGRLEGPMHVRFILQPLVAIFLAIRAGLQDARSGEPPFLAAVVRSADHRRERLRRAWGEIGKVFLVASLLDAIYQVSVHAGIYLLELVATATLLALVPYGLVRDPAARIARALLAARDRSARRGS